MFVYISIPKFDFDRGSEILFAKYAMHEMISTVIFAVRLIIERNSNIQLVIWLLLIFRISPNFVS